MALLDDIVAAVWAHTTRTLVSGTPDAPTTHAEEVAQAVWTYTERTLTSAPAFVYPNAVLAAGNWSPSEGTDLLAPIIDTDDATYITSSDGTGSDTVHVGFPALVPTGEVSLVIRHRLGN